MAFEWYESDDTTAAGTTGNDFTTTAGTAATAIELHCWLNKGSSVGTAETRYLRVYVLDGGTYKTSGLDILDRREFEIRIIGSQNPDLVPGFVCPTTAWTAIGTGRGFQLPAIYPNCAIEIEVRVNPTYEGGASSPATFKIRAIEGATVGAVSIPLDVTVDGDLDFGGHTISDVVLDGFSGTMTNGVDAGGFGFTNMARSNVKTNAASVEVVYGRPVKYPVLAASTTDIIWPNLLTNVDFDTNLDDWTAGANWAWDTGTALHTAGATATLAQNLTVVAGVTYRLAVTVSGTAGTVTPSIGAVNGTPIAAGAGGVSQRIVAGASGTLAFAFTPSTDFDGAVDGVYLESMFYGWAEVDGVTPSTQKRVLLAGQDVATENGSWYESATAWSRPLDGDDTYNMYAGCEVFVTDGATWAKSKWHQTAEITTYASDAQVWQMAYQIP